MTPPQLITMMLGISHRNCTPPSHELHHSSHLTLSLVVHLDPATRLTLIDLTCLIAMLVDLIPRLMLPLVWVSTTAAEPMALVT